MLHDQDLLSIQEVRVKVEAAWTAWRNYRAFTQEQIDAVVEAMGAAGRARALELAEMAVEETSYGNVQDKVAKNLLNADLLVRSLRGMKTVGLLRELPDRKLVEYGVPAGVIAAIVPVTNPTSTVIYKTVISLKAGNAVVINPHPHAKKCTAHAAKLMHDAAAAAGAPEGIIQCLEMPTMEGTQALMRHDKTGVILATGGSAMVKAAYSSGKPAFGVGPGNVPVLVEKTADVADAARRIVAGKSFDYGTVCSSEQAVVTCRQMKEPLLAELRKQKAYLASEQEAEALGTLLVTSRGINPRCVGQSPRKLAKMAGFSVPEDASILCAELKGVGKLHPLSMEKLSPVLALYFVENFEEAMDVCEQILHFGGLGHTCVIYSKDEERVRQFAARMPAFRVLVNTSAPQGSVGITTNVPPSMTFGCGAMGGNSTGDNVGPQHLINIKRLAFLAREPEEALQIPKVTPRAPSAAPGGIDRDAIVAAVEKILAERNLAGAPAVSHAVLAGIAASVVDQLAASARQGGEAACPAPESACAAPAAAPPGAAQPSGTTPAAETPASVNFVCENDVREAIREGRKIYIGPRTIVTPSAREAAAPGEILVMVEA